MREEGGEMCGEVSKNARLRGWPQRGVHNSLGMTGG